MVREGVEEAVYASWMDPAINRQGELRLNLSNIWDRAMHKLPQAKLSSRLGPGAPASDVS